jgi:transcription elongation factor Elf1
MTFSTDTRISGPIAGTRNHSVKNRAAGPVRMTRLHNSLPSCPHCGDTMLAPTHSEFLGGGRIRHYWSCDNCGEDMQTSVRLAAH